ncbi:MAG: 2-dehydropantoate 2-reductase [Minwuia sp.]|nr:2-dehydropantoate 2-reductase [Minwuia sp.]
MTRVCVVGAGAIGGLIGARLAKTGRAEVSALARGETLAALRQHGWRLKSGDKLITAPVNASQSAGDLGPQDVVIIAVKAPALSELVQSLGPLLTPDTIIVPAMNGIPWWFCHQQPEMNASPVESVDPGGRISRSLPLGAVLGCVVHASARRIEPGFVEEVMWHQMLLGEPFGGASDRANGLAEILNGAGCTTNTSTDIRTEIWYKLWGNLTMNPVSAITGATIEQILADPLVRDLCSAAMMEAQIIGARLGCPVEQSAEARHEVTARLGAFKTSMLQDAEAGRDLELDAIVTAVHDIGHRLGVATPHIDGILGLTRLFGQVRGIYPLVRQID